MYCSDKMLLMMIRKVMVNQVKVDGHAILN
jgi:hypothetical protein